MANVNLSISISNQNLTSSVIGLFIVLGSLFVSCSIIDADAVTDGNEDEPTSTPFVIKVDSLVVPDSTSPFEALFIRFRGITGPTECHNFSHFDAFETRTSLEVKLIGTKFEGDNCITDPTAPKEPNELRELYEVNPPFEDRFSITVIQPDSSLLKHTVNFFD